MAGEEIPCAWAVRSDEATRGRLGDRGGYGHAEIAEDGAS